MELPSSHLFSFNFSVIYFNWNEYQIIQLDCPICILFCFFSDPDEKSFMKDEIKFILMSSREKF